MRPVSLLGYTRSCSCLLHLLLNGHEAMVRFKGVYMEGTDGIAGISIADCAASTSASASALP